MRVPPALVLVRVPIDLDQMDPQRAAYRMLADVISAGLEAMRSDLPKSWHGELKLDEASGMIELDRILQTDR